QAAFVDYGKEKHGFLSFNEIHPDYFQIPVADRKILVQHEKELTEKFSTKESNGPENGDAFVDDKEIIQDSNNNFFKINVRLNKEREKLFNKYRIQEVIKKGQILLIQVVKEERGNKGAALTTYISLAGRYCVLMANTARKGGISRRITQSNTRKKLKSILDSLNTPENMAVIIRTAGEKRTKLEIKRDFNYLLKTWKKIRETTLNSVAPILIHEENSIIKRAIRDLLTSEISNVFIEGEFAFKSAREYMKTLIPSKVKIIKKYIEKTPLFQFYSFESKLDKIHDPIVNLDSGGYIVINQTEALVAVDVNSGRATKERNIEETALQTNKQAAAELCRQIKIRNLSGLIVIDFIDMLENKNNRIIE
ncbi:MAG TPA: Rne/Rng family ribonuclease, partial [Candidatus Dadabacteria bacterium]|nr:Rne/Rng family ribonuclease [Candidatus Dadabacteria bacterium]